jgi:hypothetical protein
MFKNNKYHNWYFSIINRAKTRKLDSYFEKHHIIPVCLGGSNKKENIVKLTAREHFICHLLLVKMNDSNRLKYALVCMMAKNKHQENKRYIPASRIYEMIKTINSKLASEKFIGKQKHNIGKKRAYNPITNEIKLFKFSEIPDGWILGNSPNMKESQRGKNKGKIYYHNPNTGIVIALNDRDIVPDGFIKGNPSAATRTATGTVLCHNPITFENRRFKVVPEGWIIGSGNVRITNGIVNKQIPKNQTFLPEGYYYGWTTKNQRKNSS